MQHIFGADLLYNIAFVPILFFTLGWPKCFQCWASNQAALASGKSSYEYREWCFYLVISSFLQ